MGKLNLELQEKILLKVDNPTQDRNYINKQFSSSTTLEIEDWLEVYAQDQVYFDNCGSKRTYHISSHRKD